jgi:hypothetical protein
MSTVLDSVAGASPRQRPSTSPAAPARQTPGGPPLQVVPHAVGIRRAPSLVALVVLVAAGLVGLLLLNTAMQRRAFELTALNERADALSVRVSALTLRTDRLESTAHLAARATRLGMVPNPSPVFLRLSDSRVIGDPMPATAGSTLPGLVPTPPPSVTEPSRSAGDAPTTMQNLPASPAAGEDGAPSQVPDDVRSPSAGGAAGAGEEPGERTVQQR